VSVQSVAKHAAPAHAIDALHALPHEPQFDESSFTLTQRSPH